MSEVFEKFLQLIKPINSYDDTDQPKAPDYSNLDSWAAHPDIDGYQFFVPDNNLKVNRNKNDVDVFYIHPTGCFEQTWNSDMSKNHSTYERTEIMLSNQVTPFNDSCNIYAPEYRQATYYSYFAKDSDGTKAHDLAFEDILNSFNYFIENFNDRKPYIIMSHSQGALHAQRLISKYIQDTDLQKRMICAYVIGYIIPEKEYETLFPSIPKSVNFNDTNCLLSWCTVAEGFKRARERTIFWKPSGWDLEYMDQRIYGINPFSWNNSNEWISQPECHSSIITKADNYDFADRLSSLHSRSNKSIQYSSVQDFTSALNSKTGLLEARGPLVDRYKKIRYFNGDLHSYDVMLFWGCLRKNIKDRINAFI
tara:strand:+ start:45 stop:1139 length:1095 start_codon:yes stop_codon:yes gene_type:complete